MAAPGGKRPGGDADGGGRHHGLGLGDLLGSLGAFREGSGAKRLRAQGPAPGGGGGAGSNGRACAAAASAAASSARPAEGPEPPEDGAPTAPVAAEEGALFDGFRREEVARLVLQALSDLGLGEDAVGALQRKAGVRLEAAGVAGLRRAVLEGDWGAALAALALLGLDAPLAAALRFLLLEQKCLELARRDEGLAQACLEGELSPAAYDAASRERLRRLATAAGARPTDGAQLVGAATGVQEAREALWERISGLLPPGLALPPRRLSVLLWQAVRYQQLHCLYHDAGPEGAVPSLLQDDCCEPPALPTRCIARLQGHADEVWFAAVSRGGRHIASSSRDRSVILWEYTSPAGFRAARKLLGHSEACSCLAWSPDDRFLLTACNDRLVRLWDFPAEGTAACEDGEPRRVFAKHMEPVTSVGWLQDSRRFVSAGFDRCIYLWDVDGAELHRWEVPSRIQDLSIAHDGRRMLVVDSDRTVKVIDAVARRELPALPETDAVTSICASSLRGEVLVNVAQQVSSSQHGPVIRLWDLDARRVVQRYIGHSQGRFVVRSCFGGPREEFVCSGSEDAQVYIWHRHYGSLLRAVPGHKATVNAVCWTEAPRRLCGVAAPSAWLVTASDDHTLRVWAASRPGEPAAAHGAEADGADEAAEAEEDGPASAAPPPTSSRPPLPASVPRGHAGRDIGREVPRPAPRTVPPPRRALLPQAAVAVQTTSVGRGRAGEAHDEEEDEGEEEQPEGEDLEDTEEAPAEAEEAAQAEGGAAEDGEEAEPQTEGGAAVGVVRGAGPR